MKRNCRPQGKQTPESPGDLGRREFLGRGAVAAAAAAALPSVFSRPGHAATPPNERLRLGCIGVGRMGLGDMQSVLGFDDVRVVAVCDLDRSRVENARKIVDDHYGSATASGRAAGCAGYEDFRELIARDDIDAVLVCTPDHWHTLPCLEAARAGKDIFLQKPLTLTIEEGRVLSDTVQRYGRILQVGSQQRSDSRFRFACELVRNGRIGEVTKVEVGFGVDPGTTTQPVMPVPENLNYDFWLGPAPDEPYTEMRVHPEHGYGRPGWLRIRDYGWGMLTGWGAHHLDIAQWGLGRGHTTPVRMEGRAEFPRDGLWDVHGPFHIDFHYADGLHMVCADNREVSQGVRFIGTEGEVYVRRGHISTKPADLLTTIIGPDEIHLYESNNHMANWFECIRTRREPVAPVENGHRSCSVCILGGIAVQLQRPLQWDPDVERFTNDDEAQRMVSRPMRAPWTLRG